MLEISKIRWTKFSEMLVECCMQPKKVMYTVAIVLSYLLHVENSRQHELQEVGLKFVQTACLWLQSVWFQLVHATEYFYPST